MTTPTTQIWDDAFETVVREHVPSLPAGHLLEPDVPLSAFGLDSMGMVGLIAGLEDGLGVSVPDEDMRPSRFATPAAAWETVQRCRARSGCPR